MVHTILEMTGKKIDQIVILESSSGGTAVAVNKTDDTVFVKVSPPRGWNLKGGGGGRGGESLSYLLKKTSQNMD